jgi:hypothetical protein
MTDILLEDESYFEMDDAELDELDRLYLDEISDCNTNKITWDEAVSYWALTTILVVIIFLAVIVVISKTRSNFANKKYLRVIGY